MTKDTKWLETGKDHSFYLIGDSDRREYYPAIIGLAKDNSHVAYSRDKLIECFMQADNISYEVAEEWIEYNVERSLPYYGEHSPVILDVCRIKANNKKYIPLKISVDI